MEIKKLLAAQALAQAGTLFAPNDFLLASQGLLLGRCNGCGAEDSWFRPPETMYGTSILAACIIHDWMYSVGTCLEDKEEADRVFLNNMFRLIDRDNEWYKPTFAQRRRALKYYEAVKYKGGPAFWAGKN